MHTWDKHEALQESNSGLQKPETTTVKCPLISQFILKNDLVKKSNGIDAKKPSAAKSRQTLIIYDSLMLMRKKAYLYKVVENQQRHNNCKEHRRGD